MSTRILRKSLVNNNPNNKRYTWNSVGSSEIPICRFNLFGFGFQSSSGSSAYNLIKLFVGCIDNGETYELGVYKTGNTWRFNFQSWLKGCSGPPLNSDVGIYTDSGQRIISSDISYATSFVEIRANNLPNSTQQ